jgi:hypothetical protein
MMQRCFSLPPQVHLQIRLQEAAWARTRNEDVDKEAN